MGAVQSLLSAHDLERFAVFNTTWKGHKYSRGILGFDVRPWLPLKAHAVPTAALVRL